MASYLKKVPEPGLLSDYIKNITFQLLQGLDFLHLKFGCNLIMLRQLIFGVLLVFWNYFGCILELFCQKVLLHGNSDVDQLIKIFPVIGLPKETDWPCSVAFPRNAFIPKTPQMVKTFENINKLGKDLLLKCLAFNPAKRMSAHDALSRPSLHNSDMSFSQRSTEISKAASDIMYKEAWPIVVKRQKRWLSISVEATVCGKSF